MEESGPVSNVAMVSRAETMSRIILLDDTILKV